jgi:hypothetical protein
MIKQVKYYNFNRIIINFYLNNLTLLKMYKHLNILYKNLINFIIHYGILLVIKKINLLFKDNYFKIRIGLIYKRKKLYKLGNALCKFN